MMIATDTNVRRVLQQLHDAAVESLAGPPFRPYVLGVAISFITTTVEICRQLAVEERLPDALEAAQRNVVAEFANTGRLTITQSNVANGIDADQADAHYRHLRNCFGHVNWQYDEATVNAQNLAVTLEDYNNGGNRTFAATIQLPDLVDLAERLLLVTFNNMPAA